MFYTLTIKKTVKKIKIIYLNFRFESEETLNKLSNRYTHIFNVFIYIAVKIAKSKFQEFILSTDLQAGFPVEFFVGFTNKGAEDYLVESMEASFRYPMDYTYYIQNFTALPYNKEVKPKQEATFAYSFIPNEGFAGRPFGLNIQLNYRDASGNSYQVSKSY